MITSIRSSPYASASLSAKYINFIGLMVGRKASSGMSTSSCIDNPERRSNFKQAQEERVTLDKAYFGVTSRRRCTRTSRSRPVTLENPADHRADVDSDRCACWAGRDRHATG
ncbi:hypothetical protein ACNUIY_33715 [Pseudomonas aeruginosa]